MTFVNNNNGSLGNQGYFEVRWFTQEGSESMRYSLEEPQRAKDERDRLIKTGTKANLVVVSTTELLPFPVDPPETETE